MKIIVGLGNPGPRYDRTRHNLGFMALDALAAALNVDFDREKYKGLLAEARLGSEKLLLIKPQTYMNLSGDCVAAAARNKIDSPKDILVVTDDINLPLGRLRMRDGGSAGGHNGLKSLIERLGSQDFARLRMGVGDNRSSEDLAGHVLSKFSPEEWPVVGELVARAADAIRLWVEKGAAAAMNQFNR